MPCATSEPKAKLSPQQQGTTTKRRSAIGGKPSGTLAHNQSQTHFFGEHPFLIQEVVVDMIWIMRYFGYFDFGLLASDRVIFVFGIVDISWIWGKLSIRNQSKSVTISQTQSNM